VYQLPGVPGIGYFICGGMPGQSLVLVKDAWNLGDTYTAGYGPWSAGTFVGAINANVYVRLVRIGPIPLSIVGSTITFTPAKTRAQSNADVWNPSFTYTASHTTPETTSTFTLHFASILADPPTCTTPSIPAQTIPSVQVTDFGGVNSTAGGKDFTMEFSNCSNHSKISYQIDPSGTSPNPS